MYERELDSGKVSKNLKSGRKSTNIAEILWKTRPVGYMFQESNKEVFQKFNFLLKWNKEDKNCIAK